ncbi:MAG: AI-2E family transporter [Candidatus Margulisiibacteriota bacterium]|jgi:predicted PurR-regulated permease PerM
MGREEERLESYRRTAAVSFVVIILLFSFLIVRPFFVAIMSAAVLAFIFYPLYGKLAELLKNVPLGEKLASLLTCLVILLVVLIPSIFVAVLLTSEVKSGYHFLQTVLQAPQFQLDNLPPVIKQLEQFLPQLKAGAADLVGQLIGMLQDVLKVIPNVLLQVFITIFSIYYFLVHGHDLYKFFADLFPLSEKRYKQIVSRFDNLSRGVIIGQVFVGCIQGVLAWLGFFILGVPSPILWGSLTAIISMIPLFGAALIWVPVDIYLFLVGTMTGNYIPAISLLVYGVFVISLIDNLLKPKIVGDNANIHPLIVLFGILGGIQLFGIAGIILGPMILTIFDVVIEIFKEAL